MSITVPSMVGQTVAARAYVDRHGWPAPMWSVIDQDGPVQPKRHAIIYAPLDVLGIRWPERFEVMG